MYFDRVIIDDERTHVDGGVHLRTSASAMEFLNGDWNVGADGKVHFPEINILYLDHDLGGEDTIRPVVDWLAELAFSGVVLPINAIFVHTANPVGADWILRDRQLNEKYNVTRVGLENFVI